MRGRRSVRTCEVQQHSKTQHSTPQYNTAQHSTAQHSTAQHSTAQQGTAGVAEMKRKHNVCTNAYALRGPEIGRGRWPWSQLGGAALCVKRNIRYNAYRHKQVHACTNTHTHIHTLSLSLSLTHTRTHTNMPQTNSDETKTN